MIRIIITCQQVGTAKMYEYLGKQGSTKIVPTYKMSILDEITREYAEFAVTRDSSEVLFAGQTDLYGEGGECPPSACLNPYSGRVRTDCKVGYAIQLFEQGCPLQESLQGQGSTKRINILIHRGPGASKGCFMIGGGRRAFVSFRSKMRSFGCDEKPISVAVLPRHHRG